MRKKRIMIIGPSGSKKTLLAHAINGKSGPAKRTQNMVYGEKTLDVPGVYLESPWMHKHIIAAAQDASHVLMVADRSLNREIYPPGFAKAFRVPVIGVITGGEENRERDSFCARQLRRTGVKEPYYRIDPESGAGIDELMEALKTEGKEGNEKWSNLQ
ncbi:MAG: EutP/PduV family microcompartment system protein [Lacrimispora sp.]|uniref:EutP/PduV family microcompartment system protein n=1 Tax=Lacrimispora sp. TaxID=2719234 RepID=UPI0039E47564